VLLRLMRVIIPTALVAVWVIQQPSRVAGAATVAASISGNKSYQTVAGFGSSEAFGQALVLFNDPAPVRDEVLNLLYGTTTGAGLTILRSQIGGIPAFDTIEPTEPASSSAAPHYAPLGTDDGQAWLAQTIMHEYGVHQFIADSWGAPPFMKTNSSDDHGGFLCGVSGSRCASGDWRQAYANYLVQYATDYKRRGVPLSYIGFENEPTLSTAYSSMLMTPAQAADFADILGSNLRRANLPTGLECCSTGGWNSAAQYVRAIEADPRARAYTKIFTSHGYTKAPTSRLAGWRRPVWETEWSTFDNWDAAWDDGTDASGLRWAERIYTALTSADVSAFFYWWGSNQLGDDNEGLIRVSGMAVSPSGRLWAFANYSRFVRPGAVRISAKSPDTRLDITAFRNTNGSFAIVVLNRATSSVIVRFSLSGIKLSKSSQAVPYLTDTLHDTSEQKGIESSRGRFQASVPARALVTYLVTAKPGGRP
jgi:O-glycosyl hydrolase